MPEAVRAGSLIGNLFSSIKESNKKSNEESVLIDQLNKITINLDEKLKLVDAYFINRISLGGCIPSFVYPIPKSAIDILVRVAELSNIEVTNKNLNILLCNVCQNISQNDRLKGNSDFIQLSRLAGHEQLQMITSKIEDESRVKSILSKLKDVEINFKEKTLLVDNYFTDIIILGQCTRGRIPESAIDILIMVAEFLNIEVTNKNLNILLYDMCKNISNNDRLKGNSDFIQISRLTANEQLQMIAPSYSVIKNFMTSQDYKKYSQNNPSSKYNALKYQQRLINKYVILLTNLSNDEKVCTKAQTSINNEISKLQEILGTINPNKEEHFENAKKNDWKVMREIPNINGQSTCMELERYYQCFFDQLRKDFPAINIFSNNSIKKQLQLSYIEVQRQELNRSLDQNFMVPLFNNVSLTSSTEKICNTNPSIIRGKYNNLPQETKDDPINMYKHTIEINNNDVITQHSIIRNGHIHGGSLDDLNYVPPAAEKYIAEMIKLSSFVAKDGFRVLVDNRLMYGHSWLGGEGKLYKYHKDAILRAVDKYNKEIDNGQKCGEKLKIYFLNFPPKNWQRKEDNIENLNGLISDIISSTKHAELKESNSTYKMFFEFMSASINDAKYFYGEKGYNLGFATQYIGTSLGIAYSEGCKSNKDRGSMKKMHDEIYYAKSVLEISNSGQSFFKNFNRLNQIFSLQQIVLNNSSAHITGLNTAYSGNKNTSGVDNLLAKLGFRDIRTLFTGMSKYAVS